MWNNLNRWQKSAFVLVVFYITLYTLGRMFVPISRVGPVGGYKWPPLIYSIFMVLPILLMKYSRRNSVRATAGIILVLFMLIVLVPIMLFWHEWYRNALDSSGNPLAAVFSILYIAPVVGGLIVLMFMLGRGM